MAEFNASCLTDGKQLFSVCSALTNFHDCCKAVVEARIDYQCLFDKSASQLDWAAKCCTGFRDAQCHGYDCAVFEPSLCCVGAEGMVFPAFGEAEALWNPGLRIFLYLLGLGWLFMAVTVAADMFMQSVETITSTQRMVEVIIDGEKRKMAVQQWNDTVANLTLMALGSSAPEILLSIIELFVNNFHAGNLGPSTIVGSASFNLFIISAICISALPENEVRFIKDTNVYLITATFSVFAYIWIVIIIELITPERVEVWEGLVTLAFSIVLIVAAYLADVGKLKIFTVKGRYVHTAPESPLSAVERRSSLDRDTGKIFRKTTSPADMEFFRRATTRIELDDPDTTLKNLLADPTAKAAFNPKIRQYKELYENITDRELLQLLSAWMEEEPSPKMTRAHYRSAASHIILGAGSKKPHIPRISGTGGHKEAHSVSFELPFYSCIECDKMVHLDVIRHGPTEAEVTIPYKTVEGTALNFQDYIPVDTELIMGTGVSKSIISIEIVDDDLYELDEHFYVQLGTPRTDDGSKCVIGSYGETRVTIIDDDVPGVVRFGSQEVIEGPPTVAKVKLKREHGCSAEVTCDYQTFPQTAIPEKDYIHVKGEIKFKKYELEKEIIIPLLVDNNDPERRKTATFKIVISNAQGGLALVDLVDGERKSLDQIFTIVQLIPQRRESLALGDLKKDSGEIEPFDWRGAYKDQFFEAIFTNGSREEAVNASVLDHFLHAVTAPFKVILAITPPSDLCNGWLRFSFTLVTIAVLTALINDMAQLLGCALGIPDAITAVTFVALGTSIPDTFASRMAAVSDTHADNSIGNITGSNAVNVFLGLGISWSIGAIYWETATDPAEKAKWIIRYNRKVHDDVIKSGGFAVRSGTLKWNVITFCICAMFAFFLLGWRRIKFGGELGGPKKWQYVSSIIMTLLWVVYIIVSAITSIEDRDLIRSS